jgi:two-component system LytT family sensor kinase
MTGARWNRAFLNWAVVCVAAWTAFPILISVWVELEALYEGRHPAFWSNFGASLGQMYTLGLFSPVFIYVVHAFPPTRRPLILTLGIYLATLIGVWAVGLPLFAIVSTYILGRHFTIETTLQEGLFTFFVYAVVLTIVVAITQVQVANERAASALRLEADLSKLRVEALQRQLHPHFIFNTLNAVSAVMHTDVNAAEEMIAALADLLRTAAGKSNSPMVPLREELNLLDRYVLIMKLRYGERLVVTISAEPRTLEVAFPTFTLQPLVENAIVHSLEKTSAGITVGVACRLEAGVLVVEISDDGAATDAMTLPEGVGLGNTRARLAELYGNRASLSVAPRHPQGMCFTLAIPAVPAI